MCYSYFIALVFMFDLKDKPPTLSHTQTQPPLARFLCSRALSKRASKQATPFSSVHGNCKGFAWWKEQAGVEEKQSAHFRKNRRIFALLPHARAAPRLPGPDDGGKSGERCQFSAGINHSPSFFLPLGVTSFMRITELRSKFGLIARRKARRRRAKSPAAKRPLGAHINKHSSARLTAN